MNAYGHRRTRMRPPLVHLLAALCVSSVCCRDDGGRDDTQGEPTSRAAESQPSAFSNGGYRVVFQLETGALKPEDNPDLARRVSRILEKRVDPKGTLGLRWQPLAWDRVEVLMPKPSNDVLMARTAYNRAFDALSEANLDEAVLDELLVSLMAALREEPPGPSRDETIQALKQAHPGLAGRIDEMVAAYDAYVPKRPLLEDPGDLIHLVSGAGVLEFRILASRDPANRDLIDAASADYRERVDKYIGQLAKLGPQPQPGDHFQWFKIAEQNLESFTGRYSIHIVEEYAGAEYVLAHSTPDMGLLRSDDWSLRSARAGRDSIGRTAIDFTLGGKGPDLFGKLTGNNLERPLCIFLDDEAISAASIRSAIYGNGQISGSFTQEYVNYLVNTLEAGVLPVPLKDEPLEVEEIPPPGNAEP